MDKNDRRGSFAVIAGVGLIALGVWLVAERILGPALEPLRVATRFLWSIVWPLALIGLGALILLRRDSLRPTSSITGRRFYRSRKDRMVSGVIGGLAAYSGLDSTLIRILYALITVVAGFGPGVIIYIIATIIVPEEPPGAATVTPHVPLASQVPSPPSAPEPPAPAQPGAPESSAPMPPSAPEPPAPESAFTPPAS